jgi:hypothetical protein
MAEEEIVAAGLMKPDFAAAGAKPNERTALDDYLARKAGKDPVVEAALADVIHVATGGQSQFGPQDPNSQADAGAKVPEKAPAKQQKSKAKANGDSSTPSLNK